MKYVTSSHPTLYKEKHDLHYHNQKYVTTLRRELCYRSSWVLKVSLTNVCLNFSFLPPYLEWFWDTGEQVKVAGIFSCHSRRTQVMKWCTASFPGIFNFQMWILHLHSEMVLVFNANFSEVVYPLFLFLESHCMSVGLLLLTKISFWRQPNPFTVIEEKYIHCMLTNIPFYRLVFIIV